MKNERFDELLTRKQMTISDEMKITRLCGPQWKCSVCGKTDKEVSPSHVALDFKDNYLIPSVRDGGRIVEAICIQCKKNLKPT